jgi:hypothetical protein
MSCGCKFPRDEHSDYNNITYNTLLRAMVAGNVDTVDQLIENIEETYAAMQGGSVPADESTPADEGMNDDIGPMAQPAY